MIKSIISTIITFLLFQFSPLYCRWIQKTFNYDRDEMFLIFISLAIIIIGSIINTIVSWAFYIDKKL